MDASGVGDNASEVEGVAIIGMAGRFPKAASVDALWSNLLDGVDGITTLSDDALAAAGVPKSVRLDPAFVPRQGVLSDIDLFDAGFFGYSPAEAAQIDPQHRFFLEMAWEALEHAGIDLTRCRRTIGIYGGCGVSTYLLHNVFRRAAAVSEDPAGDFATIVANDKDFLTTRVAYKLGLTGPAVTVQTACSTSLVAVHMACQALLSYECDIALAGGITITVPHGVGYRHQEGMIFSPDGRCRAFDAEAAGAVFGSGGGIVVLKRAAEAMADGDTIDAVILGTAINNDGADKAGYTAPSVSGQARAIALAQEMAAVSPAEIGYVEAHGTATPLGDALEVAALREVFSRGGAANGSCRLGTIKSAIGHLDTGAGVAGLIKTALALRHGEIPPTQHVASPNPALRLESSPFVLADRRQPWPDTGRRRIAGVSAFGIGGTNAHAVVSDAPKRPTPTQTNWTGPGLLLLSARSPSALSLLTGSYARFLRNEGSQTSLADLCGSAMYRRTLHPWRLAVAGRSPSALAAALEALAESPIEERSAHSVRLGDLRRTVFVYPGQGSQWEAMGRDLLAKEPVFRSKVAECADAFSSLVAWDLESVLRGEGPAAPLDRIDVVQPALFAMQLGLTELWRSRGVTPDAVIGHSMGEATAAAVSGALSVREAARVICRRSALLTQVAGRGAMLATELSPAEAENLLQALDIAGSAEVAVVNGPRASVLSGDRAALERLAAALETRQVGAGWVKVDVASHGRQVDSLEIPLRAELEGLRPRPPAIPFFSTVTGGWIEGASLDADYWWRNMRGRVRFHEAIVALAADGHCVFLEASPHPVLVGPVQDILADAGSRGFALGTLRRRGDSEVEFAEAVGRLFAAGQNPSLAPWLPERWSYVRLPHYAWEHRRYWIDAPRDEEPRLRGVAARAVVSADLPATSVENPAGIEPRLARLWTEVLGAAPAGREANFFLSGGHSLMALRLLKRIQSEFGIRIDIAQFVEAPTPAALESAMTAVSRTVADSTAPSPLVLTIQGKGDLPPLFMATPILGTAFPYFPLAAALGPRQPLHVLVPPGVKGPGRPVSDIKAQARLFADAIERVRPSGIVQLGGWSFGAPVAFETARELDGRGRSIAEVLLIDTPAQLPDQTPSLAESARFFFGTVLGNAAPFVRSYVSTRGSGRDAAWRLLRVYAANARASINYRAVPWRGAVALLRTASAGTAADRRDDWGWSRLAQGGVRVIRLPGNHMSVLQAPFVESLAAGISVCLAAKPPPRAGELPSGRIAAFLQEEESEPRS